MTNINIKMHQVLQFLNYTRTIFNNNKNLTGNTLSQFNRYLIDSKYILNIYLSVHFKITMITLDMQTFSL